MTHRVRGKRNGEHQESIGQHGSGTKTSNGTLLIFKLISIAHITSLLSQDPSDSDSGESLMYVPDDEASPNAKGKDKGKRKRSRSRSITPPPPLSQEQIMLTKQSIRYA